MLKLIFLCIGIYVGVSCCNGVNNLRKKIGNKHIGD